MECSVLELEKLSQVEFDDVKLENMPDLKLITIDKSLSLNERREAYLKAVGNPYMVRVGKVKVKIRFSENGESFQDNFSNMLSYM